jgi:hypothetical protein
VHHEQLHWCCPWRPKVNQHNAFHAFTSYPRKLACFSTCRTQNTIMAKATGAWQDALPLVVANNLYKHQPTVSALLCTSRAAAGVVMQSCTGRLELQCELRSVTRAKHMAAFLAKHAMLLRTLQLQLPAEEASRRQAEQLLAAALLKASTTAAAAAAARSSATAESTQEQQQQQQQQLLLQGFSSKSPCLLLLQQVAASCRSRLTRLQVCIPLLTRQALAEIAAADLLQLTALRSLSLTFGSDKQYSLAADSAQRAAGAAADTDQQGIMNSNASRNAEIVLDALAQLKQLTHLQLNVICNNSSTVQSLTRALAVLQHLCCLQICHVPLNVAEATEQLGIIPAAAAALTKLQLLDCELDDRTLLAVLRSMSALQSLDVSKNPLLTDAALATAAEQLTQLVELNVEHTYVTRAACSRLQGSRPGLQIMAGRPDPKRSQPLKRLPGKGAAGKAMLRLLSHW